MVDKAVARSREGNIFTRTVRDLTGKPLDENRADGPLLGPAIVRMLDKIRRRVERKPVDATVEITRAAMQRRPPHRPGRAREHAAQADPPGDRLARPPPHVHRPARASCKPKVGTADLGRRNTGRSSSSSARAFRLKLYKGWSWPRPTRSRSAGRAGDPGRPLPHPEQGDRTRPGTCRTATGRASLAGKVIPGGSPENPIKARWMGVYDGAGIHGTADDSSIGSAASHGCIRMHIPDVEELYDKVPVGAPIYIA